MTSNELGGMDPESVYWLYDSFTFGHPGSSFEAEQDLLGFMW